MLLGAGAGTIVPVRVGARVVAILVAEAHVAAVVVVAAAPRETLNHRTKKVKPNSRHIPIAKGAVYRRAGLPFSPSFSFLMELIHPPTNRPISTTFSLHTPYV